jgi:hypothetical protein
MIHGHQRRDGNQQHREMHRISDCSCPRRIVPLPFPKPSSQVGVIALAENLQFVSGRVSDLIFSLGIDGVVNFEPSLSGFFNLEKQGEEVILRVKGAPIQIDARELFYRFFVIPGVTPKLHCPGRVGSGKNFVKTFPPPNPSLSKPTRNRLVAQVLRSTLLRARLRGKPSWRRDPCLPKPASRSIVRDGWDPERIS